MCAPYSKLPSITMGRSQKFVPKISSVLVARIIEVRFHEASKKNILDQWLVHGTYIRWYQRKRCAFSDFFKALDREQSQIEFFSPKTPIFIHSCEKYSELPFYRSTFVAYVFCNDKL